MAENRRSRAAQGNGKARPHAGLEPILSLDTQAERPTIKIDGGYYELRRPDEFGMVEAHRLWAQGRLLEQLGQKDELGEEDAARFTAILDELCRQVLLAPDKLHQKLKDPHRNAIIRVFLRLQQGQVGALAGATAIEPPPTSTGESSSPGSSASMGDPPSTG